MVFVVCGAAAIPAWVVIDRGNSVGFLAPIGLIFLVALCRRRWGLVTIMVVLAALVKPQFAVLAVALFAARQWRLGGTAAVGVVISNIAAYALWPRDFPQTIMQSMRNTLGYNNVAFQAPCHPRQRVLWEGAPHGPGRHQAACDEWRNTGDGFLAGPRSLIGYAVLALVVVSLLALRRRIAPVKVGIVLLATASLFPP